MNDYSAYESWLRKKRKKNGEKILNSTAELYLYTARDFFDLNIPKSGMIEYMNKQIHAYNTNTHRACFVSILEFYDFPEEDIKTLKSPKYNATAIKSERFLQSKLLSIEEIKAIIDYIRSKDGEDVPSAFSTISKIYNMDSLASELCFRLLYDTACRKGEIIRTRYNSEYLGGLKVRDIDFKRNEMNVVGKGHKRRAVFIAQSTVELLQRYIDNNKLADEDNVILFRKHNGLPYVNQEYECWKFIKLVVYNALSKKYTPHCLRHTRISHWADEGAELLDLKELAGHSSPNTTMIYIHISNWRRRKASEKYAFDIEDRGSDKTGDKK